MLLPAAQYSYSCLHIYTCRNWHGSPRRIAAGFQVLPAVAALGVESTTPSNASASHFLTGIFWSGWEWVHGVANVTPA